MEFAEQMQHHNKSSLSAGGGVIVLIEGSCIAHILHRELESHFATKSLIPNLYSVAFSCSLPGVVEAIAQTVKDV